MANEKRLDLVDRKQVLKELRKELQECRKDADEFGGENILWAEGIEFAIDTVKQAKTVDAVEVVHGRWIKKPYLLGTTRYCSVCGQNYGMSHVFNYCPNCGARMKDGDGDG